MVRLGLWLWKRISDWYTGLDLLEAFGWKTTGGAMVAGGLAAIYTFFENAPTYDIFLAWLAATLIVLAVVIAAQPYYFNGNYGISHHGVAQLSPLEIEFENIEPVRWEDGHHGIFNEPTRRKHFGISVHNRGSVDVAQVSVEIERIEQVPNRSNEIVQPSKTLGLRLKFKTNNATSQTFHADFRDRVSIISHVNAMMMDGNLLVASTQRFEFPHNNCRHRIYLKVTGEKVLPVTDVFTVWVDSSGLQMQRGNA